MQIHNYEVDGIKKQCITGDADNTHKIVNGKIVPKTQSELATEAVPAHNAPIIAQLEALDKKRIRPLAEGDAPYLATLNSEIAALRAALR